MEFLSREEIMNNMTDTLGLLLNQYDLDDIGIYEEEGAGDGYYMGYTIKKDGKVFMINLPYVKNQQGELAVKEQEWTIQSKIGETKGYKTLEAVFKQINDVIEH